MQLVQLRRVINHRAACACCAHVADWDIEADDHSSRSVCVFCFRCFSFLQEVTLVRSNKALT